MGVTLAMLTVCRVDSGEADLPRQASLGVGLRGESSDKAEAAYD